jgi:wyosine [tRNA(Phe)-imidazoG37] synthetase (radical SAM superfamily)
MIAFGPIPSRRLGRSLGINNIPPKVCTYSCVYCQVGRTINMQTEPHSFYEPAEIVQAVRDKIEESRRAGEPIDYLTFVPDGEPTLDVNLGKAIEALKPLGIRIAVISNASTLCCREVRQRLLPADWVSVKVDTVMWDTWRRVNRPHRSLELEKVLDGVRAFGDEFSGELASETMLVTGLNDSEAEARGVARFLSALAPATAYLSIPTRPPAEDWACPPEERAINRFYQVVHNRIERVEYLIGYEGNAFAATGDPEDDLLSITAVHPMREEAVDEFLTRAGVGCAAVEELVAKGKLKVVEYQGRKFFMRALPGGDRALGTLDRAAAEQPSEAEKRT